MSNVIRQGNELVSVVVPVYNAEKYLSRCLDSLLAQTYTNFELICVNDGSTDHSGKILDAYVIQDSRIRVMHIPNGGVSNARNTALNVAKGKYVLFVDADDWVEPEHIALLLPIGDEDLVYGGYNTVVLGQKTAEFSFGNQAFQKNQWSNNFAEFWRTYTMLALWRGCYKTEIICNNQLTLNQDMTVGEDEHFNLRYLAQCQLIRFSDVCTYNYEVGDHPSAMHRYHQNRSADCINICQTIEDISQQPEYAARWYYWHYAILHLDKWHKKSARSSRRGISQKLADCFNEPYFRECIPYIRKHGSLDEKIETFFMRSWLHSLYKPTYSIVVFLSRIKNYLLRK